MRLMIAMWMWMWLGWTASAHAASVSSAAVGALPTIEHRTQGMQHLPGFLPLHWDSKAGRLYLEIPRLDSDMLYFDSLPSGTGSTDLELDRGQVAKARVVRFTRVGAKIFLVRPNEFFRSSAKAAAEQLAVRQSFPESVLAAFAVAAEELAADGRPGAVLVDATDYFLTDVHHAGDALTKQGIYKLDPARSAISMDATRAFPNNSEIDAMLTFASDAPAPHSFIADVAPDAHAMTVHEHHSFLQLPAPGFVPRRFDPRAGYFPMTYRDYAAPLGAPLDQQFILRHRLQKRDPNCVQACEAVAPIRYYVDNGAPEPIRSALVEGARWWDQAFQAAGWARGTFVVDVLPDGADIMDARYNVIQWVHRFTRGWSYGHPVADPRTGEIIKGNVTLGSLRSRQDYLIAEALLSPYVSGGKPGTGPDPLTAMVLARTRQLAAHETGHTLGLAHNFAASSVAHGPEESVSVMDYPHPWIVLRNGVPDLSQAYAVNIGIWDKVSIDYGYRQLPAGADERAVLDGMLEKAAHAGLLFITDEDSRPLGSAHPRAHLWDNGSNPVTELRRILAIRTAALARFGENAIPAGAPLAQLEDTLVPLYLMHRYQTEAASKLIGGLDYRYQLRGDGQPNAALVPAEEQKAALQAVLETLSVDTLLLPERLLALLPPRPPGLERSRESMPANTGLTFDPIAAAEAAADLTLQLLFDPQRAARLIEYAARNPGSPGLQQVIDATLAVSAPPGPSRMTASLAGEIRAAVHARTVEALLGLARNARDSVAVRAVAYAKLEEIRRRSDGADPYQAYLAHRIREFQSDPDKFTPAVPIEAPPGMPIGDDEE
jgi:hypothetical protein